MKNSNSREFESLEVQLSGLKYQQINRALNQRNWCWIPKKSFLQHNAIPKGIIIIIGF